MRHLSKSPQYKTFCNAAMLLGMINLSLRAVKDFLKQDLSHLEIAVQPEVSRGEIRRVCRPIISSPASSRHHSVPKDVCQEVHWTIACVQGGPVLSREFRDFWNIAITPAGKLALTTFLVPKQPAPLAELRRGEAFTTTEYFLSLRHYLPDILLGVIGAVEDWVGAENQAPTCT